jgi:GT2 family glycosyltransferase
MIHISIPYSYDKNFFEAIQTEFEKLSNPNDWLVIMDGDTMFLQPDFGCQLQDYINLYPKTGLFTCYASRCSYSYQVPQGVDQENPNVIYHKMISDKVRDLFHPQCEEIKTRIAGHLMMIQKKTWERIFPSLKARITSRKKAVLGVDTQITWAMIKAGYKVRLMKGVYIMHYFRLLEGRKDNTHLS